MMQLSTWVKANWLLLLVLALIVSAFPALPASRGKGTPWGVLLHSTPSDVASLDELNGLLGAGRPAVIEFYSNFPFGRSSCLLAKPIVDGLERKLNGKVSVIRLDVMSQIGRQAAARFGVRGVPTLILVDGKGEVALRQVGILRPGDVHDRVDELILNGRRE